MNRLLAAAAAGLTLAGSAAAQTPPPLTVPEPVQTLPGGTDYAAVLASPVRTDEDRARDAARMTEQTLRFTGVRTPVKRRVCSVMRAASRARSSSVRTGEARTAA